MKRYKVELENIEYEKSEPAPNHYITYVNAESKQNAYIEALDEIYKDTGIEVDGCIIKGIQEVYEVLYYASHPSEENDDCLAGADYDTLEEALEDFNRPVTTKQYLNLHTNWVILQGPDVYKERKVND